MVSNYCYLWCLPTLYQSLTLALLLCVSPVVMAELDRNADPKASATASATLANQSLLANPQSEPLQQSLQTLETWRSGLGSTLDSYVDNIDRFIGDSDLEVEREQSRFKLYFPANLDQNATLSSDVKFRASVDLPRSKNRWQIMISSYDETLLDSPDSRTPGTDLQAFEQADASREARSEVTLSVQRSFLKDLEQQIRFRVGLKFQGVIQPNPYLRLNYNNRHPLPSDWLRTTTHNLILERIRGWVLESRQSFAKPIGPTDLFKSQTTGTWMHRDKRYLINQRFTWYEKVLAHRFYAYFLDANWVVNQTDRRMENVALGFNWRERLYKDWLFAEFEPRMTWRQEQSFSKANPSLFFQLEMHFYR